MIIDLLFQSYVPLFVFWFRCLACAALGNVTCLHKPTREINCGLVVMSDDRPTLLSTPARLSL